MAKAELTLEASYYNLSHDAWEPILEPVVDPDDESHYTPWTLQAEVSILLAYSTSVFHTEGGVPSSSDFPPQALLTLPYTSSFPIPSQWHWVLHLLVF